jgi:hypothetical protein
VLFTLLCLIHWGTIPIGLLGLAIALVRTGWDEAEGAGVAAICLAVYQLTPA